jgi:hypothetical protein
VSFFGKMIGAGVGEAVSSIASPFINAWVANKKALTDQHVVTTKAATEITVASMHADVEFAQAQRLLNAADASHWSTRWIRPAFAGLSFAYFVMALFGWLPTTPIPQAVEYVLAAIPGAIFLLRPLEKNKRVDIAASAAVKRK